MRATLWAALASVLALCAPLSHAADGAALYAQHCATCHQADGSGTVGLAPPLKGEHWQRLGSDRSYLAQVITHGLSGLIIATHLLSLQERPGPAYSAADMASARSSAGSPPQSRALRMQLLK